jgi:hypothetical protein
MLSWFRKKSKDTAEVVTRADGVPVVIAEAIPIAAARVDEAGELIRRWDAKRTEIRRRVEALLAEAEAASEPLLESVRTDLTPLTLPWNTIAAHIHDAREEISEAWNQISDEMSECESFTHEMMFSEGNKRDLASLELELLHERVYGTVMARAAERMRRHALTVDAAQHSCSHCGAPLDRVTPVSQSLNVECGHCKAVNTVHPGDALRMFAASGAMHLAAEAARPAGEAMKRIEKQINQYREAKDVPLRLLIELESTSRIYWTARLGEEARYNPEQTKYVAAKLERYMLDTVKTLRRYWQWREYETTRPPPGNA